MFKNHLYSIVGYYKFDIFSLSTNYIFLMKLPLVACLASVHYCLQPLAVSHRWEWLTVGLTGSLGIHYIAAWTGGGREARETSCKAGLAGWTTSRRPLRQVSFAKKAGQWVHIHAECEGRFLTFRPGGNPKALLHIHPLRLPRVLQQVQTFHRV